MYDYFKIIEEIGKAIDELAKMKDRCKVLEEQLNEVQASAIVYQDLYYKVKRRIFEDLDE